MADQFNAIIKIRRGLDSDRRTTVLESGEIAYSTDVKRMFVGDGSINGGTVVGNTNYIGTTPNSYGIKNDLFFDTSTYNTYILSSDSGPDNISNYVKISPSVDDNTLKSTDNVFSINTDYFNNPSTGYLRLIGGTMGGYITLHNHPTLTYHAATKGFVDQSIASLNIGNLTSSFVKISGDTMTGKLTILSSIEVSNNAVIGGGINVLGDVNVSGDLNLNNNLFKNFRPVIKNVTLTAPTSTYELLPEDNGSILVLSGNSVSTRVYCPDDFDVGYNVMIIQNSDSNIYILPKPSSTAIVNQIDGYNTIRKKYGVCNTVVVSDGVYVLAGDLS